MIVWEWVKGVKRVIGVCMYDVKGRWMDGCDTPVRRASNVTEKHLINQIEKGKDGTTRVECPTEHKNTRRVGPTSEPGASWVL